MREVICINVGQAGIQMANATWELFCNEHGIQANGKLRHQGQDVTSFETFFQEVPSGNYVPRAISVDLEPSVLDEVRSASYRHLWHPDYLINCCEDAANNFARGHFTVGKNIIKLFMDRLRRYGGGTGSGLSSLIFENLDVEYSKSPKFEESIFPAPQLSTAIVEPYNAILSASKSMEHTDLSMLLDNESSFRICCRKLSIPRPSYSHINRLIAQLFSAMTVSIRFGATLNNDLAQLQTNLIPFPRIHFPIVNYAPIVSRQRAAHEILSVSEITRDLFDPTNQLVQCHHQLGRYISCCIQYRGLITPRHVNAAVYEIKRRTDINFVDWCPTGFKLGICPMPPVNVPGSELASTDKNCTMFCNTTAVVQLWQRINKKFDLLFMKRAFVHWYVSEGMEEGEFNEAREDLVTLERDYTEIGANTTNSFDDDKEYNSTQVVTTQRETQYNQQEQDQQEPPPPPPQPEAPPLDEEYEQEDYGQDTTQHISYNNTTNNHHHRFHNYNHNNKNNHNKNYSNKLNYL